MKYKTNKRWIIVGLIWGGVLVITCWNVNSMDRGGNPQEKGEISRAEIQFLKYNSENISRVLGKKASFHKSVESLKLGLLSVENQLHGLAVKCHLQEIRLEKQPVGASQENMLIELSFQGSLESTLKLLNIIQKDYPYLLIKQVKITPRQPENKIRFQILFNYRYRIASVESQT